MSREKTPSVFDRSFGAIVEGACPSDGARLERREGWGYGFCPECGAGWSAVTGPTSRGINHYLGRNTHWSETGLAWMDRDGLSANVPPPGAAPLGLRYAVPKAWRAKAWRAKDGAVG